MTDIPPLPDEKRPVLCEFLAQQSTMALGTAGIKDGRPQVSPVFFASDEALNLYWISSPDGRHSQNITDWNDVAAAVYADTWEWSGIKGVQIEGDATAVTDDNERQHALDVYTAKFPFVTDKFADLIEQSVIYVLRPRWLRWLDNERRFGYKQEYTLEPPANGDD
ncbi:MAG: pyridoxamine 5'-phosphate oxidase family protein [Anaerolineae bacterium]|nr:pyridoxamine 5'-phosphate oxidase family protein [Anaerolineae bacterium]